MAVELTRRRFTVDEYYAMGAAGILGADDRVELIDGEIIQMPPIGPGHGGTVNRINFALVRRFGDLAVVTVQNPIHLNLYNDPQPDIALARPRTDFYRSSHPEAADVFLVIEVSDTTLATDQRIKMPLYARAGLPEAWLIDLQHDLVRVHREPATEGYRVVLTARRGERLAPLAFPDRDLAVDDLLG
jgi:Uma2 family endonuclease